MQACGQHPNPQTYAILLDGIFKKRRIIEGMALFWEMEDKRLDCYIVIYSILIDGFCNVGELMTAREIFSGLPTKGLKPNVWTYTIMNKGFCKNGLVDEASFCNNPWVFAT